jgi:hypothetical protein
VTLVPIRIGPVVLRAGQRFGIDVEIRVAGKFRRIDVGTGGFSDFEVERLDRVRRGLARSLLSPRRPGRELRVGDWLRLSVVNVAPRRKRFLGVVYLEPLETAPS